MAELGNIIIPLLQDPRKSAAQVLQQYAGLQDDEHGKSTPNRFLNMLDELTKCKGHDTDDCSRWTSFAANGYDQMIVMESIPFTSVCNHHVIPFIGTAAVAYIPDMEMVGLSKLARVVQHYAQQLQVQERLTQQVADYLMSKLDPRGVVVSLRAEHLCMTIRGVQAPGTFTTTTAVKGVFADHDRTAKAEFLSIIGGK